MAITHKTCLILDEVDGMSGGDRGGVGAMNALIKKTRVRPSAAKLAFGLTTALTRPPARPFQIPMILICNDKSTPKMKPFQSTCAMLVFRKCVRSFAPTKRRCLSG